MKASKEQLISYEYMPLTYEEILSEVEHELEEQDYLPDYTFGYDNLAETENFMNIMSDRLWMYVDFILVWNPADWDEVYMQREFYLKCRKNPQHINETIHIILDQDWKFEVTWARQIADKLSEVQKSYLEMIDKLYNLIENYNDWLAN